MGYKSHGHINVMIIVFYFFQTIMDESFQIELLNESIEEVRTTHQCDVCGYQSAYKQNLTRHMKNHLATTEPVSSQGDMDRLVCQHCGKSFKSRCGLQDHIKDKHLKVFKYTCEVCSKGFNRLWNYKGHLNCHHKELREKCDCGKQFQYKTSLIRHKKQCTHGREEIPNPNPFECTLCGSTFKEKKTMKDHMRGAHGGKEYQCHVCGKLFSWRSSLSYHFNHFDHP